MSRKIRTGALIAGVVGLVVAIGCTSALYLAGTFIDEHQIDPDFTLIPLFAGVAVGILAAVAGLGTWVIGYVPGKNDRSGD